MKLGPQTKVNDLLTAYPFLKDYLVSMDSHFKALESPIMRKTLGRVATLSKAAMVVGVDLNKLISGIAAEVLVRTGQTMDVDGLETPGPLTDPSQRHEALKQIIKDLHAGHDMKSLKHRFMQLVRDVAPMEIAQMEQRLISEGMPEDEVKRLCDVHVEVFKESLEDKVVPGLPSGHPVHTHMLENRHAERLIGRLKAIHDINKDRDSVKGLLDTLSKLDIHYARKENQLFPLLEARGISGPSKVMWALHNDIRKMLKDARAGAEAGTLDVAQLQTLIKTIEDMIYKEEHILFPMALEALNERAWLKVRDGEEQVGYAWIKPEGRWEPSSDPYQEEVPPEKIGSISLETGMLSVEQINLLLTHLPVDVSFVDEDDTVAYYSNTAERIFPRSPGIIGRKVQNCHPTKSVHMVERILREFKEGTRDTAEFWIQMRGKFIHIRYFAVRDRNGKYKGTIEVSQDVTGIRGLEGEQRLLDWK